MKDYTISYAQNREDIIIDGFFANLRKGFYIDVGANHPENDSVTKLFYDKGWHGINIEPTKYLFELLEQQRPNDTNLNIGISNSSGELNFREYKTADGLSTFSDQIKTQHENSKHPITEKYRDYKVPVKTLAEILDEENPPVINFMKIDVEGYEYEVLEGNNWEKYRPQLICIEANHVNNDWHPLLKAKNYILVFYDGLNEYFVTKENNNLIDGFSYEKSVIGRPSFSVDVSLELSRQQSLNKKLEADRLSLRSRNNQNEKFIYQLHQTIQNQRRIKQLMKLLGHSLEGAALMQIDKIDKPSIKSGAKFSSQLRLPNKQADRERLLFLAHNNDLDNFYAVNVFRLPSLRHILFVLVLNLYKLIRRILVLILKFVWKVLRNLRKVEDERTDQ